MTRALPRLLLAGTGIATGIAGLWLVLSTPGPVPAPYMRLEHAPFDMNLYREVGRDLDSRETIAGIGSSAGTWLATGRIEAHAAALRLATDPSGPPHLTSLLRRRVGCLPEEKVLAAVAGLLDNDLPSLTPAHQRVLAGVVSGHATSKDLRLAARLLIRLGVAEADVAARIAEIQRLPSHVRAYRTVHRIDPGTPTGIVQLRRIISDAVTEPAVRHEAIQKAILAPPAAGIYALHRGILTGEHRAREDAAGPVRESPDAYQVRLMRAYGAASCEEAVRLIDERLASSEG